MFELAGRVGLPPSELMELTASEFYHYVKGFSATATDERKFSAELKRNLTMMLINTQLKTPISNPKKLIKFGWEVEKPRKLTAEEIERIKAM